MRQSSSALQVGVDVAQIADVLVGGVGDAEFLLGITNHAEAAEVVVEVLDGVGDSVELNLDVSRVEIRKKKRGVGAIVAGIEELLLPEEEGDLRVGFDAQHDQRPEVLVAVAALEQVADDDAIARRVGSLVDEPSGGEGLAGNLVGERVANLLRIERVAVVDEHAVGEDVGNAAVDAGGSEALDWIDFGLLRRLFSDRRDLGHDGVVDEDGITGEE